MNKKELINSGRRCFIIKSCIVAGTSSIFSISTPVNALSFINDLDHGSKRYSKLYILTNSIGFNGERLDPVLKSYHLGNGYRVYIPSMMRFNSPDSLSPFSQGGINTHGYCFGDPINLSDPSGHISVEAGIGIGLGILGVLISIATLGIAVKGGIALIGTGASLAAGTKIGLSVTSGAMGVASAATGLASVAVGEDNAHAENLSYASLGLGIGSLLTGAIGSRISLGVSGSKYYPIDSAVVNSLGKDWSANISHFGSKLELHGHGGLGLTSTKGGLKSGAELAEYLREQGFRPKKVMSKADFQKDKDFTSVVLESCYGAFGGKAGSQAQVLANELDVNVTSYVFRYTNNINSIHRSKIFERTYKPQSGAAAANSLRTNNGLSVLTKGAVYLKGLSRRL
ncbi:RHS repeat-associated core domain-containing protein [Aliivibrio sifiae]|uniref:RHS repeat-associated core domain-containing protein n=1 Tax=Aliivibrio sifiae TaxID=566293 RepID=A0A2S7X2G5_9GAMM|nr:RHS repeat-associated core domain-containing protein [Aliivibrio sifiae]PQJ84228.1 hypothetical protein BTO22_11785 [Aliivibrio sifiae]